MRDKFEHTRRRSERIRDESFHAFWVEVLGCSELINKLAPIDRRRWLHHVIQAMYEEQGGTCAISGASLDRDFEVDHVVPHSLGGGNERANLRLVNKIENRRKGNRGISPDQLLAYLEDRYMNLGG
jgi:5-methylcytosine-specific restriction endonuclease McrA